MQESNISINYWKEVEKDIPILLNDLKGITLLTHNSIELTDLVDFINKIKANHFTNILYISLVRSYGYIKSVLELKPLDKKRVFIIDCVSGFAFPYEDKIDECMYHKPPQNLEEMKKIINFGIEKAGPDVVILDSLSQFINFTKPTSDELEDLYDFLRSLKKESLNIIQDSFILLYDTKIKLS
jgi:hypothetical protein